MSFVNALDISGSALTAQKMRMDIISQNIANANTTRTEDGDPYRRQMVVFQEQTNPTFNSAYDEAMGSNGTGMGGVEVVEIVEDQSDLVPVYNPGHPDADAEGYVWMPNVDTTTEMIDMMSATRSYEANVTVLNATKDMAMKALEIGK